MYFDPIYRALSFIILMSAVPFFFVTKNATKDMSYDRLLKIRPWISVIVYLAISAILCAATILKIQYVITLIDIVFLSIAAFVYSLVDIFYFQEIKKEHIWNLQNQFVKRGNYKTLFSEIALKGKYEQIKEHEKEKYSVVETENDGSCILLGGDGTRALKPNKEMSPILLQFYAKCLSLDMEELPVFNKEDDLERITKNYQFFKPSFVYLFIRRHSKIMKRIAIISLIVVASTYLLFLVFISQDWFGLGILEKLEIQ